MKYEGYGDIAIDRKIFEIKFGSGDKDMERIWKQNKFRPCSDPKVTFPIIIENGISINKFWKDDKKWTADVEHPNACDEYNTIEVEHENPLRAACICFLLMKDEENEPTNPNPTSR